MFWQRRHPRCDTREVPSVVCGPGPVVNSQPGSVIDGRRRQEFLAAFGQVSLEARCDEATFRIQLPPVAHFQPRLQEGIARPDVLWIHGESMRECFLPGAGSVSSDAQRQSVVVEQADIVRVRGERLAIMLDRCLCMAK